MDWRELAKAMLAALFDLVVILGLVGLSRLVHRWTARRRAHRHG
jgi:hypothetical protein